MSFDTAVELILKYEGGYVFDPKDAGGETNFGISKRAYPDLDIAELTKDDAKQIYKRDYWDAVRASEMPSGIGLAVFDMAVNAGVRKAVQLLQRVAGVNDDGIIGPVTLEAVNKSSIDSLDSLIGAYAAERIMYYSSISVWDRFGRGWTRRAIGTAFVGLEL